MKNKYISLLAVAALTTAALLMGGCQTSPTEAVTADTFAVKQTVLGSDGKPVAVNSMSFDGNKDKVIKNGSYNPATGELKFKEYASTANAAALESARWESYYDTKARQDAYISTANTIATIAAAYQGTTPNLQSFSPVAEPIEGNDDSSSSSSSSGDEPPSVTTSPNTASTSEAGNASD